MAIDSFESFLWVDRYSANGDFEIYSLVDPEMLSNIKQDFYIYSSDSEHLMIVDEMTIKTDIETGNHLLIRGESLEAILKRRIIWNQTVLSGNFQNAIQFLIDKNVMNPTDVTRKIANFKFQASTDPTITSLTIRAQFTGKNLYDTIKELCDERDLGFKIVLNDDNEFVFSLYRGADRSYEQETNPYVIFAPGFENIINSNYFETGRSLKTIALVAGEGEGVDRKVTTVGGGTGLLRRELFVDARDIQSRTLEGDIPEPEYMEMLEQRGNEYLSENSFVKLFEGDVETTIMFVYGRDFFMGDVVQLANEWAIEARARVIEIIFSQNREGINVVPTFSIIEEENYSQ